ncbi:MAG: hypothetical protein HY445_03340 [Candidatus Niyogibacteria bacterium]|nr:hypothetical protein [Candidatus Niyogibacteria bacterium]
MTKKEIIWREILVECRQNRKIKFTQKELAEKFGFSVSTVFNALKAPRAANSITVSGRFFILEDYRKLLYFWATERAFEKDIIYQSALQGSIKEVEAVMPPHVRFGLYSAFRMGYRKEPAEYDHLYVYAGKERVDAIRERIADKEFKSSSPNFFVLESDSWLRTYQDPIFEQIFVDIWNAPEWYAKDFLKELERDIL